MIALLFNLPIPSFVVGLCKCEMSESGGGLDLLVLNSIFFCNKG